jgi:hypothetical protein
MTLSGPGPFIPYGITQHHPHLATVFILSGINPVRKSAASPSVLRGDPPPGAPSSTASDHMKISAQDQCDQRSLPLCGYMGQYKWGITMILN